MKFWSWAIALVLVCSLGLLVGPGIAESRVTAVSEGNGYGIALNDNGTVWLWGGMDVNGTVDHSPVIVKGVDHVVAISEYMYPAVLKDDGTVWIINPNSYHYVNGVLQDSWPDGTVQQINGLSDIVAISGNSENLMALKQDGTVWMVGNNAYGQLGTEDHYGDFFYPFGQIAVATQVRGLSDVKAIALGRGHALALKNDGTVWTWGLNGQGELGNGNVTYTTSGSITEAGITTPAMVRGLTNVTAIDAGFEYSMALKDDGTVWTWGTNMHGVLGASIPENVEYYSTLPVQVDGLTNIVAISGGERSAFAIRDDGTVWAWGDNANNGKGMLGDGTIESKYYPVQVKGLNDVVSVSAGWGYNYALDTRGVIWAWGTDYSGQLGDGRHGEGAYSTIAQKVPFSDALSGPEVRPSWMVSSRPPITVTLPVVDNNSIDYMTAVDGMIYAFSTNGLQAMDGSGAQKWSISIAGAWTYQNAYGLISDSNVTDISYVSSSQNPEPTKQVSYRTGTVNVKMVPTFATEDGHVYLYALADASDSAYDPLYNPDGLTIGIQSLSSPAKYASKVLLAVGPDGSIEWTRNLVDNIAVQDKTHIEAHNGKIYLYHDYNESVFDTSGNLLYTINNVAAPGSIDEDGNIYVMPAVKELLASWPVALNGEAFDYRIPSNVIEKYGPDGRQIWQKELPEAATQTYFSPSVWNSDIGIPLYLNGMLYVPIENGTMALNKDGAPVWTKKLDDAYTFYYMMPKDSEGNVYLYVQHSYDRYHDSNITVVGIKPDGTELGRIDIEQGIAFAASEGVLYLNGESWEERYHPSKVTLENMEKATVVAYDLKSGAYLWNFTTPIGESSIVIVNKSNVMTLFPNHAARGDYNERIIGEHSYGQILPSGDYTYISFRTAVWDEPVFYNNSTYTYFSALYALDKNGKLVWQKPMDSFVTAAAANNSTIYYGTNGGGISTENIVVAGAAIAGTLLAFFLFGSVTRARSQIDKNDNRNRILSFIVDRPGSTLYEMSKELGMNIGTLRYHLMILGLNHRIVTYNDDSKFVRYFTNSNTYSDEDKMIISLLRRESMGRLLKAVLDSGEITNGELCVKLGLPESGISKYMSELSDKGVVTKTGQGTRMYYSIREMHRDRLAKAIALIDSNETTVQAGA